MCSGDRGGSAGHFILQRGSALAGPAALFIGDAMYSMNSYRMGPIGAHSGCHSDFLVRYRAAVATKASEGIDALKEFYADIVALVADTRDLRAAWDYLARYGGDSPGPDNWRYADFDDREVWSVLRLLSRQLLCGDYAPGPERALKISKGPGRGMRTLRLQNILDRVVGRAIVQIWQPLLEPTFHLLSFGGRPALNRWHALAHAMRLASLYPCAAWITADIKNAFDSVPLGRLLDVVRSRFASPNLTTMISRVISNSANRGLRQGSPLSPLLMNLYLDHVLDKPWQREHPDCPLIRYVDDLLIICPQSQDPTNVHGELVRRLTPAGMLLKTDATASIHRLEEGEQFRWLGYRVACVSGKIRFQIPLDDEPGNWFDQLRESLAAAHSKPNSPLRANEIILSALENLAPCRGTFDKRSLYERIRDTAGTLSFEEIPEWRDFKIRLKAAHRRWKSVRESILSNRAAESNRRTKYRFGGHGRLDRGDYVVCTDGACLGNGDGGWAYVVLSPEGKARRKRFGRERETTNNEMELQSVIRALHSISRGSMVVVRTDSRYVADGINGALLRWQTQGWRAGGPGQLRALKHVELWQEMEMLMRRRWVRAEWVPAHAGDNWNEWCDRRAWRQARSY